MTEDAYLIPARECSNEIVVINSRFITKAAPVFSVEEAKVFLSDVKSEFPDASHHVPAYIIGHGTSVIMHCSDAGEPSGTAGRPVLAVLKGSKVGDVAIVVTRYFGGTKLGKGGLVRAYGDSVKALLEILPLARKQLLHNVLFSISYALLERTRILVKEHKGEIVDEIFSVDITVVARFAPDCYQSFQPALHNLTNGNSDAMVLETKYFIVPL